MRQTLEQRYLAELEDEALGIDSADRGPWSAGDFVRMLITASAGAIGWGACWYGASGDLTYSAQVPWLVGSIASAAVFVLGLVYWVVSGFRHVRLIEHESLLSLMPIVPRRTASATNGADLFGDAVTAPGMTRYHRRDCLLVTGKEAAMSVVPLSRAETLGLVACGMCRP